MNTIAEPMRLESAVDDFAPPDSERLYSVEEYLALPDAERFELVDGHLSEPPVSTLSSWVEGEFLAMLREHVMKSRLGWVFTSSNLYRCFPDRPDQIRKPDVSFIARDRFGPEHFASRIVTIAPDLAVEVVSPNDKAEDLERKVHDYLLAGVRLVWLVFPEARLGRVHRPDGSANLLTIEDAFDGESVLPGLRLPLLDLFSTIPTDPSD